MDYTPEQLATAARLYESVGRDREATEKFLLLTLGWDKETIKAALNETERYIEKIARVAVNGQSAPIVVEDPAPETVAPVNEHNTPSNLQTPTETVETSETALTSAAVPAVAVAEPVDEGMTDDELVQEALGYLNEGMTSDDAVVKLIADFEGVAQLEAEKFVRLALDKKLEAEQAYADECKQTAGDAVDKQKEAEAKANHLFVENLALKARKKMPQSEEDIQKAKVILEWQAAETDRIVEAKLEAAKVDYPEFPEWVFEGTSFYENHVKPICEANPGARVPHFNFIPGVVVLLNYIGNKVQVKFRNYKPSLYMVLVGKKGKVKKTSSINDAIAYMELAGVVSHYSKDMKNAEGRSLIWEAGSSEGLGTDMQRINARNAILYYDELSALAKKANIESSTIRETLLKGYESGKFGNSVKGKKDAFSINPGTYTLSLLSSCTKKRFTETYASLGSGEDGLDDRFSLMLQPEKLERSRPQHYVDTKEGVVVTRKLIDKAVSQQTFEINDPDKLLDKAMAEGLDDRSEIRAEKYALYFAVDLGRDSIDSDCIARGLAIVRYELAVKKYLKLAEADSKQAVLQIKIRRLLENAPKGTLSQRDLERKGNAHRHGTYNWGNAISGLLQAGIIRRVPGTRADSVNFQVLEVLNADEGEDDDDE